jgi:hypothetical protein
MAWTVRLEDKDGVPEDDEFLVIEFGSLPAGAMYPLCSMIGRSPYYDTLLNPYQRSVLIAEIDAMGQRSESLDALKNMAQKPTDVHVYLRFIGD